MIDFARTRAPLARLDLGRVLAGRAPQLLAGGGAPAAGGRSTFACVLNTDVSSGPGKHWVALFGDARAPPGEPWTVEYFNSAGNPPPREVLRWTAAAAARLGELRAARGEAGGARREFLTGVRHQRSRTECGLYALFFIRARPWQRHEG